MVENTVSCDIFFMTLLSQSLDDSKLAEEIKSSIDEDSRNFIDSFRANGIAQKTLQMRYFVSTYINYQFSIENYYFCIGTKIII